MNTVSLLNTSIPNIGLQELLAKLNKYGGFVVTPNVDHVVRLQQDVELLNAYQQAGLQPTLTFHEDRLDKINTALTCQECSEGNIGIKSPTIYLCWVLSVLLVNYRGYCYD